MQTAILLTLGVGFAALASNQKHLVALGWLSWGVVAAMVYFYQ